MLKSKKQKLTTLLTPVINEIIAENSSKRLNESMNAETIDRIESVVSNKALKLLKASLEIVAEDALADGFELDDVKNYLIYLLKQTNLR